MRHKVVVVGAGYFGQRHLKILTQLDDVEIVGVVDRDYQKAQSVAQSLGVNFSDNVDKFISEAQVFLIVTPTNTHYEIARQLIEQGKDLFIEKPMVETPSEATQLFNQAKKRGTIIQVGLIERYNPVIDRLLNEINSPLHIQARRESTFQGRALDTDVTFDLMIHDLDLVWYIFRNSGRFKVKTLKTYTKRLLRDRIDIANVWLEIESNLGGIQINLTANRIASDFQRTFTVIDRDAVFYADLLKRKLFKSTQKGELIEIEVTNKEAQPLYLEIGDFLQAVRTRVPSKIAPSPEEVVAVLKIINKINGGD